MIAERSSVERYGILVARLHGTAKDHASWGELAEAEHAAVGDGPS
ncbi:MAG TPA: hypothetical protein VHN16_14345 [Streptosporangiaceae bacterium]|nr:hypothetical protein [Streptosporangiaceae bacterium]